MAGHGDFVSFSRPQGQCFALRSCPGVVILSRKGSSQWERGWSPIKVIPAFKGVLIPHADVTVMSITTIFV